MAPSLLREVAASEDGWPGLTPWEVSGVRQDSRLVRTRRGASLVGILPLGLFPTGHSYWVQADRYARLGLRPYCLRPQLGPLASARDTAASVAERTRLLPLPGAALPSAGLSHGAAPTPPAGGVVHVKLQLADAARAQLAAQLRAAPLLAHVAALASQLRVLRAATAVAASLGWALEWPRGLMCYCDRDPSAAADLIAARCKLASAEAEDYLPFRCPPEHVLDLERWRASPSAPRLLLSSARDEGRAPTPATIRVAVPAGLALHEAAAEATRAVAAAGPSPAEGGGRILVLDWADITLPPELGDLSSTSSRRGAAELDADAGAGAGAGPDGSASEKSEKSERLFADSGELAQLIGRGPRRGWCVPGEAARRAPASSHAGALAPAETDTEGGAAGGDAAAAPWAWCLNFSRLLLGPVS